MIKARCHGRGHWPAPCRAASKPRTHPWKSPTAHARSASSNRNRCKKFCGASAARSASHRVTSSSSLSKVSRAAPSVARICPAKASPSARGPLRRGIQWARPTPRARLLRCGAQERPDRRRWRRPSLECCVQEEAVAGVSLYPAMDTGAPVAVGRSPRSASITHW